MVVKSFSYDQHEILKNIIDLYNNGENFECDITYGKGNFYKNGIECPKFCFDIEPLYDYVVKADSRNVPLKNESIKSIVFDPPFLTYIKNGRNHNMIMAKQFSGYWSFDDLVEHYISTINEIKRILKVGGILVFKCQDIIHNHRYIPTHSLVTKWCCERGFEIIASFILLSDKKLPFKGKQKNHRISHSYFLVFKKRKNGMKRKILM